MGITEGALVVAGEKYGIDVKIETQGSGGIENNLTPEDIKDAACVILSTDVAIQGEERFHGTNINIKSFLCFTNILDFFIIYFHFLIFCYLYDLIFRKI